MSRHSDTGKDNYYRKRHQTLTNKQTNKERGNTHREMRACTHGRLCSFLLPFLLCVNVTRLYSRDGDDDAQRHEYRSLPHVRVDVRGVLSRRVLCVGCLRQLTWPTVKSSAPTDRHRKDGNNKRKARRTNGESQLLTHIQQERKREMKERKLETECK